MYYNWSDFRENKVDLWANSSMRGPMRQNTVGCIPSLAGLQPISIDESSVSNLVLSTGSNHYVIHVPAHSYAHPIHVTRTCKKPSFQTILLQGIFGYQFEGSTEHRKWSSSYLQEHPPFFGGSGRGKMVWGLRSTVICHPALMRVLFPLGASPSWARLLP